MKITNPEAFRDAQSLAHIAYFAADPQQAKSFWAAAVKSLKQSYGVK